MTIQSRWLTRETVDQVAAALIERGYDVTGEALCDAGANGTGAHVSNLVRNAAGADADHAREVTRVVRRVVEGR